MYYMIGIGGMFWKSKDLKFWEGLFYVVKIDFGLWMGLKLMIWVVELYLYKGKYYYFVIFINQVVKIDMV